MDPLDPLDSRDPWFKRFAQYGPGEAGLQLATLEARGLHAEGQRLMHSQGQPYGHLAFVRGTPLTPQALGLLLNCPTKAVIGALDELLNLQIWKKNPDNVLFDPQLIALRTAAQLGRYYGAQGGNPALRKGQKRHHPLNPSLNHHHNPVNPSHNPPVNPPLKTDQRREEKKRERRSDARAPEVVPDPGMEDEPIAPTPEEVVAYGQGPAGIPEAYCRKFHSYVSGVKKWLTKTAYGVQLVDWRRQLHDRWVEDRASWQSAKKNAAPQDAETLRQKIEATTDPGELKDLRKRLSEIE